MTEKMTMYLAIWKDRHTDDNYTISENVADAVEWCSIRQTTFYPNTTFITPDWAEDLIYYKKSDEDGPTFQIEEIGVTQI